MASSLTAGRGGRSSRHLICAVCREVFRSPRLLPCFHSFCVYCLEGLVRQHGRLFPCPQCRRATPVPLNGALGFQLNFHISEEDLELARNEPADTMCPNHDMEPLVFFCKQCDQAICIRCKLTKHDHHETEDLSDTAARCQGRLEVSKDRLENTISFLTKKSSEANDSLQAAKMKSTAVKEQVQAQRDLLVAKVDRWRDEILRKVEELSTSSEKQLSEDTMETKQGLDTILHLRQRVNHAMKGASDAEKVGAEKEMRLGQGSEQQLQTIRGRVPDSTVRPGLNCDQTAISDDDIHRYLGFPVLLTMPSVTAHEDIVPIYGCGTAGACREVHAVCYVTESAISVSYGGTIPDYHGEQVMKININGDKEDAEKDRKGRTILQRFFFHGTLSYYISKYARPGHFVLKSKGSKDGKELFEIATVPAADQSACLCKVRAVSVTCRRPFEVETTPLFDVKSGKPTSFDASKGGLIFAVVEEAKTNYTNKTDCKIHLFRRGEEDPFTTYAPPDVTNFHPADVCFWSELGEEKLLVADSHNDSVHVVKIEDDTCHLERYLAAGNGHLVRPTALDVDSQDRVWIGCGNGWVLRCEKRHEGSSVDRDDEDVESARSVISTASRQGQLVVENSSHCTDAMSEALGD